VKQLIDKKVIEATDKLGQQLLASIALYTDATIGEVRDGDVKTFVCSLAQCACQPSTSRCRGSGHSALLQR
jgi:hypothetical protein